MNYAEKRENMITQDELTALSFELSILEYEQKFQKKDNKQRIKEIRDKLTKAGVDPDDL